MAALLTNATTDGTATVAATGPSRVIVSGTFTNNAKVILELDGDSLDKATIAVFTGRKGIKVESASGDNFTATVKGGDSDTSIDVSVTGL